MQTFVRRAKIRESLLRIPANPLFVVERKRSQILTGSAWDSGVGLEGGGGGYSFIGPNRVYTRLVDLTDYKVVILCNISNRVYLGTESHERM